MENRKEPLNRKSLTREVADISFTSILGVTGGTLFGKGFGKLINYFNEVNSVRDFVYSRATEITPEVIQKASELSELVSKTGFYEGTALMATAGFVGSALLYHFKNMRK